MDAIPEHREATRLGSYEILRRLARGGMAEIFLARTSGPSGFEKLVVLKKILARYADKPRYVQLFLEEAKLAASLDHPNIAQVYDIGMVDGSYFFTMEHLHGQDVRSILHRAWRIGERFPIEHAVQIARHVASALHFAHEKRRGDGALLGLVHRDVSPSNVIVTYDGATKLLDFGVAKTAASTVKTRTGALKGKISYMSPEQARGAPLDRRSDIFSLGIVLWEMVTTQRLYRGDNDFATLQLIINHPPPPPSRVRPECPPELERIVLRALAQDPEARYATADQLAAELDELAREHKLKQSSNALAATLGQLFGAELAAWREAQAAGVALADHLNEVSGMTAPVSESDFIEIDDGPGDADDDDDDAALGAGAAEVDDLDDDLTEHMAPVVDTLSPLATDPIVAEPTLLHGAPTAAAVEVRLVHAPATETLTVPTAPLPHSGLHTTPGSPFALARAAPAGDEPTIVPGDPPGDAPDAPDAPGPAAPFGPAGGRIASSPFAQAPWQSGQPAPPPGPGDRVVRSWSIIDLPAFDPELFARQRRIVLRVALGLIGVVIALAVLAGRC